MLCFSCVRCVHVRQFTKTEYEEISRVTFRDIMIRNIKSSWFRPYMLQSDVFHWHYGLDSQNPCYQPAEAFDNATLTAAIEPCSAMKTFDYFDGSAGPYIGTIISLGLYMLVNIALMVIGIKYYQNKALQSRSTKGPQSYGSGRDVWLKAGVFSADNGTPMLSELVEVPYAMWVLSDQVALLACVLAQRRAMCILLCCKIHLWGFLFAGLLLRVHTSSLQRSQCTTCTQALQSYPGYPNTFGQRGFIGCSDKQNCSDNPNKIFLAIHVLL